MWRWYLSNERKQRGIKEPLDEGERGGWKSWLKTQHSKTKIMESGPITSWQIVGETVTDFIFLGSIITADGDCSHKIKRRLLLGRKAMTNLDSILKKPRHYSADKDPSSQSYGFSCSQVWMWELGHKELMFSNCGAGEDAWEFLGLQGDQASQSYRKSTLNIHWKDWCWSSNTFTIWCEKLSDWKRPWY